MTMTSTTTPESAGSPLLKSCMKVPTLHDSLATCGSSRKSRQALKNSKNIQKSSRWQHHENPNNDSGHGGGGGGRYDDRRQTNFRGLTASVLKSSDKNNAPDLEELRALSGESEGNNNNTKSRRIKNTRSTRSFGQSFRNIVLRSSTKSNPSNKSQTKGSSGEGGRKTRATIIRFFDVDIREYEVVASENPAVKTGVPIELGWKYNLHDRVPLDDFEETRSKTRTPDFRTEKKLTKHERERILREFGATQQDMDEAAKRAALIRNARKKSVSIRSHDHLYEKLEEIRNVLLCAGCRNGEGSYGVVVEDYGAKLHPSLMSGENVSS